MQAASVAAVSVFSFKGGNTEEKNDFLAVEEPLEIQVEYGPLAQRLVKNLSVTMRTPGADADLLRGFLFTEGIIRNISEIGSIDHLPGGNVVLARLDPVAHFDPRQLERHFYTTSSCGVCGKTSIEALKTTGACAAPNQESVVLDAAVVYALPDTLRAAQETFALTGGLHAAALLDFSGKLLVTREDVGRHNALDKLIGHALQNGLDFKNVILLLSGRGSFELLQKSAMAGIRVVCAVGAPSSLAVSTAAAFGITLIGFLRGERFNVYHRPAHVSFTS